MRIIFSAIFFLISFVAFAQINTPENTDSIFTNTYLSSKDCDCGQHIRTTITKRGKLTFEVINFFGAEISSHRKFTLTTGLVFLNPEDLAHPYTLAHKYGTTKIGADGWLYDANDPNFLCELWQDAGDWVDVE